MINTKGKLSIFIIFCSIILSLTTGCLSTMIYYPARVLDKGKMYLGIGGKTNIISYKNPIDSSTYKSSSWGTFANTIYFRRGLGAGFDIGIDIKGALIIPVAIELSARKEFFFNTPIVDGIVFDVGYGNLFVENIYGSIAVLRKNTFIRGIVSRSCYSDFDGSIGNDNLENSVIITLNHEIKLNRFSVLPYISYEKTIKYTQYYIFTYSLFTSTENLVYDKSLKTESIGAGFSITFNW